MRKIIHGDNSLHNDVLSAQENHKVECYKRYLDNKSDDRAKILRKNRYLNLDKLPELCPDVERQFEHLRAWSDVRLVSEFKVGSQDVKVSTSLRGGVPQSGGGVRGNIKEWSKQSRSRCETHIRNLPDNSIKAFLTLTYPKSFPNDGKLVKRHLDTFIKWLKRRGCSQGIWFVEFQKRGAAHYHAFLGSWPEGGVEAVSRAWYRIVGSNDEKHLEWHLGVLSGRPCLEYMRNPHAASYYACKYGLKAEQKSVPDGYLHVGRFWGYWGDLKPVWEYFYGRGIHCAGNTVDLIRHFKRVVFEGRLSGRPLIYSATLRGASSSLDGLLLSFNWCPF